LVCLRAGYPAYDSGVQTLTKKEIETLLETYDHDPAGSLRVAIGSLLGVDCPTWESLTILLPSRYTVSGSLARQETAAMDDLVKQLVEHRAL
jgi:hypothetical protein